MHLDLRFDEKNWYFLAPAESTEASRISDGIPSQKRLNTGDFARDMSHKYTVPEERASEVRVPSHMILDVNSKDDVPQLQATRKPRWVASHMILQRISSPFCCRACLRKAAIDMNITRFTSIAGIDLFTEKTTKSSNWNARNPGNCGRGPRSTGFLNEEQILLRYSITREDS